MSAESVAPTERGTLLFHWERPRRRKVAIAGFLAASLALHAFCFYLFQVVYPTTISLLPPPAQVSLIAPNSDEARSFLNWLESEDPALATQTQRSADARAFQLPRLAHVPSYVAVPPRLKELPPRRVPQGAPSAMPPAPVPVAPAAAAAPAIQAATALIFSDGLSETTVAHPELKFSASSRETPESARFRLAVDSLGVVRYTFLEQSSDDAALDEQARRFLAQCRFPIDRARADGGLLWATAAFEFGNDLELPAGATERGP